VFAGAGKPRTQPRMQEGDNWGGHRSLPFIMARTFCSGSAACGPADGAPPDAFLGSATPVADISARARASDAGHVRLFTVASLPYYVLSGLKLQRRVQATSLAVDGTGAMAAPGSGAACTLR